MNYMFALLFFLLPIDAAAHLTWHDAKKTFIIATSENSVGLSYDRQGEHVFYQTAASNVPMLHMALASALSLSVPLGVDSETSKLTVGFYKDYHYLIDSNYIYKDVNKETGLTEYWFRRDYTFKLYTSGGAGSEDLFVDAVNRAQLNGGFIEVFAIQLLTKWNRNLLPGDNFDPYDWQVNRLSNVQVGVVLFSDLCVLDPKTKPALEAKLPFFKKLFSKKDKGVQKLIRMSEGDLLLSLAQYELFQELDKKALPECKIACIRSRCPDNNVYHEASCGSCFVIGPNVSLEKRDQSPRHIEGPNDNNKPLSELDLTLKALFSFSDESE